MSPETEMLLQEIERPTSVLLVNDDLFLSTRILSVLKQLGIATTYATSLSQARESLESCRPGLVMINLNSTRLGGVQAITELKSFGSARILAFINHTRIPEIKSAAITAGAERIVANSAISMRLPYILRSMMRLEPPAPEDEE